MFESGALVTQRRASVESEPQQSRETSSPDRPCTVDPIPSLIPKDERYLKTVLVLASGMLPKRRSSAHELEREITTVQLKLLRANAALRLKVLHVEKLEILVR